MTLLWRGLKGTINFKGMKRITRLIQLWPNACALVNLPAH